MGSLDIKPAEEDKAILSHCPLTNLIGENAFGDMDFDFGKRRHCSLHHRTTTYVIKKTGKWLDSKALAESSSILKTAKKNAKMLRRKHREQERLVKMKIKERVLENERLKKLKEMQAAEQKQKIIQSVLEHGGPGASARDVKNLVRKTRTVSRSLLALKAEIWYKKTAWGGWGPQTYWVMGGALRLTGSWEGPSDLLGHGRGPQTYWVMGGALRLTGSWEGPSDLLGHGRGPQTYWVMGGALRLTGSWEGPSYFLGHGRAFRLSGSWEGLQTFWVMGGALRLTGSWEGPSDLLGHGRALRLSGSREGLQTFWVMGGALRLTGSWEHLFQSLMAHLGGPAAVDNDSASGSDTAPAQSAVSARKRKRGSESDTDSESGSDSNSGELTLDEPQVLFFFFQTADAVGQCFFVTTATMWVRC